MDGLAKHKEFGVAILHWFTGTKKELARAIEMDCWFSVGSAKINGAKCRELVKLMPPERILTETGGPFAKLRGRALAPAHFGEIVQHLSQAWLVSIEAASHQVLKSLCELVSL